MIVGVPSEVKSGENRVALTPQAVEALKEVGHRIVIERDAGNASGFSNEEYQRAGAEIVESHEAVFESDLIVKVKEILPREFGVLREGKIIMAYLHFTEGLLGSKRPLAEALMKANVPMIDVGIATAEMSVLRTFLRNRKITATASNPPNSRWNVTSLIDSSMNLEVSSATNSSSPGGSVVLISSSAARIPSATATTLVPD